jgi:helix-turn-helix protein
VDVTGIGRVGRRLEPIHAMVYFAPEAERELTSAGLKPGRMCYFASRSAPMGAVSAKVVTATFYNFNPELVARSIPAAWSLAEPAKVISARFAAVDAALTRLLGAEALDSPEMVEAAGLARRAAEAVCVEGRPLAAGHLELDWPSRPHLVLWHAASILREHRGDGHIAALLGAELTGLQALVSHTATGRGFVVGFALASRGWSEAQWAAAVGELRERGVLDEGGALTERGAALRAEVEADSDRLGAAPYRVLDDAEITRLGELGAGFSRALAEAGCFPAEGVFARR